MKRRAALPPFPVKLLPRRRAGGLLASGDGNGLRVSSSTAAVSSGITNDSSDER